MTPPIWLDEHGSRAPTRQFRAPSLDGRPTTPMVVVNWCGHGQEFIPWPEADGYWTLVPLIGATVVTSHATMEKGTQL
jgi:hypothetical protein